MARTRRGPHGRQAEVLEATARIFYTKGYEAATIQDIADELGILKGSLYYYIKTKEDVLYDIIRSYHDETRAYFDVIESSDEPVVDKLRRFIMTETAYTAHHLVKSSLFFTEWRSLSDDRQRELVKERDRHDRFVRSCIEKAQSEGTFRADIDPRLATFGLLGMVNSVYQWYSPSGPNTAEEIGEQIAELLIQGMSSR